MPDLHNIEKIFLLHHHEKPERLFFQKKQLESLDVQYTIYNSIIVDQANGFQNKALKSCYASHLSIIENNLQSTKPFMILEDDAVFQTDIISINSILRSITESKEWDMIYLYPTKFSRNILQNYGSYSSVKYILNCHAYILSPINLYSIYNILKRRYNNIDVSKKKLVKDCYLDRNYGDYIHPRYQIYSCNQPLVIQDRYRFGSQLGWGWDNRPVIFD